MSTLSPLSPFVPIAPLPLITPTARRISTIILPDSARDTTTPFCLIPLHMRPDKDTNIPSTTGKERTHTLRYVSTLLPRRLRTAKPSARRRIKKLRLRAYAKRTSISDRFHEPVEEPQTEALVSLEAVTPKECLEPFSEDTKSPSSGDSHDSNAEFGTRGLNHVKLPETRPPDFELRFVDELETLELAQGEVEELEHDEASVNIDIPQTIPEATTSMENMEAQSLAIHTKLGERDRRSISSGDEPRPIDVESTDDSRYHGAGDAYSDGTCDSHNPIPLYAVADSKMKRDFASALLLRAPYEENTAQLEETRMAKLNGEYSYALYIRLLDELRALDC